MPAHDELGKRMKGYYEQIPKTRLMRRTPVIIRIDGKAFHTFAHSFKKPFDNILMESMQETMKYLCENIQGCVLGYTQSDEISLLLIDYKRFNSAAWFDNEVQKMCSISASMATLEFNRVFENKVKGFSNEHSLENSWTRESTLLHQAYVKSMYKGAMFDSRCFNIPKEEVTNYFYWRQQDATRNSIEMVGQANFSHKELHKKTCNMIQDMLHEQKGINWNDFSVPEKRGSCCIKETYYIDKETGKERERGLVTLDWLNSEELNKYVMRTRWVIDKNIPIFKEGGRRYIEQWIEPEEY
jgi:tRNA(His) 5'-end guanylyltransferase